MLLSGTYFQSFGVGGQPPSGRIRHRDILKDTRVVIREPRLVARQPLKIGIGGAVRKSIHEPGGMTPVAGIVRGEERSYKRRRIGRLRRPCMGQTRQAPQQAALENGVLQEVAVRADIGHQDMGEFPG